MDSAADDLLARAARGERAAFDELFARHRDRLGRAVALRLDRRLAARVDASDVVQDVCLEAFRRLPDYLRPAGHAAGRLAVVAGPGAGADGPPPAPAGRQAGRRP